MDILFDIDGTLVRSYPVEDEFYDRALGTIGLSMPTFDYQELGASTDVSIMRVLAQRAWQRDPTEAEVEQVRLAHTNAWAAHVEDEGIEVLPGGSDLLRQLREQGVRFAAATGGFRRTATQKLRAAELSIDIAAAAEDGHDRAELLARAAGKQRPVYVGDGFWDAEAAAANGLRFIAIAETSARADAFRARGCRVVTALDQVLDAIAK